MAKKKRLIPFKLLPMSWGLTGKSRELAEAEYNLDGEDLERRKVEINIADKSEKEVKEDLLSLDHKYGHLSDEDYERQKVELNASGRDQKETDRLLLEIDKKYGKIEEGDYERKKATLEEEPFVRVARIDVDPSNPSYGGIILDWNKAFVAMLEENGYGPHPDDEETVNEWFNELCKNVALEEFDGLGDFSDRVSQGQRPRQSMSADVVLQSNNEGEDSDGQ